MDRILLLTIPDPNKSAVFPWNKKLLSSANSTLSGFLQSNIKAIFCTFLAFLPTFSGRRHTVLELL